MACICVGCVTLNIDSKEDDKIETANISNVSDNITSVTLIHENEILVVKPGENILAPKIKGVNQWYLISDYALMKINKVQIDAARILGE